MKHLRSVFMCTQVDSAQAKMMVGKNNDNQNETLFTLVHVVLEQSSASD